MYFCYVFLISQNVNGSAGMTISGTVNVVGQKIHIVDLFWDDILNEVKVN